jgi:hypothetical protein
MQTLTPASQVFALLRRNYRVSRNTRALWQFQQIAASLPDGIRIPTSEEIVSYKNNLSQILTFQFLDPVIG